MSAFRATFDAMAGRRTLTRAGVRLAWRDFGGQGSPIVLLHGLAGHAQEWAETASWLTARCRVLAPDLRGHGHSERIPADVSRDACVADIAFGVEALGLAPVVVVGQSLGGVTAISMAARHPDMVRGLVVVDACPTGEGEDAEAAARAIGDALRTWPVPFRSRPDAEAFFADRFGGELAAAAWAAGLEEREDGWWPRFDVDVMVQTLRRAIAEPNWEDWERVSCPTLVVRASRGLVDPKAARAMMAALPSAQLTELPDAGHDLHLDRPERWRQTLTAFLDALERSPIVET
jgi:pimeloyl-ACP methyl ester carboxylesterase